jgi:hypothetical protein
MNRRSRRPTMKTTAAPLRPRSSFMFTHIAVFLTALLLAMPHNIEGLALARRMHINNFFPIVHTHKLREEVTLKLSASTSIDITAPMNSQRSLNRIQSKIVKALMVTFIASMCMALPV